MTPLAAMSDYLPPEEQAAASLRLSLARRELAEARRQERFERRKGRTVIVLISAAFVAGLLEDPSWFAVASAAAFVVAAIGGWYVLIERHSERGRR